MASYSFEPSSPLGAQARASALPHNASFSGGLPAVQSESLQGAVPVAQGSSSSNAAPGILPQPRGYRTLADHARALAEASSVSLDGSALTNNSGTASPTSSNSQLLQQRLLQVQQQQHQQQQQYQQQRPSPYPRPPDWRIHAVGPESLPVLVSDDVVSGTKRDGWMSPVRRFFCLLVTFDVIFTALLWVITVIVTGRDLRKAIEQQVLEYTIHDSMFDVVMAGAARFLVNILFYAALDVNHWVPVGLTTAGTSAFTIAKVFEYQWTRFGNLTFDVMLLLLSFVLSWGELWFLDVRVLPLELRARELVSQLEDPERAPLLAAGGGSINARHHYGVAAATGGGDLLRRCVEGGSVWGESVANFYSPLESPEDSGDELEEGTLVNIPRRFKRKLPLNEKELEYRKAGEDCLERAFQLMLANDWKEERKVESTGDHVFSKVVKGKKLWKVHGVIDAPPKFLLEDQFFNIEGAPSWNPQLTDCKTIQHIDSHTDVSYQVSSEAAGGMISVRDFVNLRHWAVRRDPSDGAMVYVSAGISIKHPAMPAQPKRVRGENGPNCLCMQSLPGQPNRSLFRWVLDTDIKGWIPQKVIDSALSGALLDYLVHLRKHVDDLTRRGAVADFLAREEGHAYASLDNTGSVVSAATGGVR